VFYLLLQRRVVFSSALDELATRGGGFCRRRLRCQPPMTRSIFAPAIAPPPSIKVLCLRCLTPAPGKGPEIRLLSRRAGLPTWDRPASRLPLFSIALRPRKLTAGTSRTCGARRSRIGGALGFRPIPRQTPTTSSHAWENSGPDENASRALAAEMAARHRGSPQKRPASHT